ncbi:uncharacterized protein K441DRAFT_679302 [Cenococcum geophilum 1.58]|uniref:uncharacterized protein n=1 Tax=Cenococcum geophilum 1.58 TaxID=794803 RepID=UPI00358F0813|nr:hypothetical protein K441DRAFT_679302 [Cenococcum geophilum 1.58]
MSVFLFLEMYPKSFLLTIFLITSALATFPPGPPTILGPITEASTFIQVTNLVSTVHDVTVFDANTNRIVAEGMPTHIRHGTGVIPVVAPLVVGHELVAQQFSDGGRGATSSKGLILVNPFKQPGPPTITSLVHTCINAIQVSDVLVGATVKVSSRSVTLGETTSFGSSDIWIDLDPNVFLFAGDVLQVSQSITFAGITLTGTVNTDPLELYDLFIRNAGTELSTDSLHECQTTINMNGGVPGSLYRMDNNGAPSSFHSPNFHFTLSLMEPLKEGIVVFAQQPLPSQCEKAPGAPQTFLVASATDPPVPTNSPPPCPDSPSLEFSGLVDGGTLIDACGHKSDSGTVSLNTDTSLHKPRFLTDLYECSSFFAFAGNPSARTTLWWEESPLSNVQLSTPAVADESFKPPIIHTPILWEKLTRDRKLFLRQDGCGSTVESPDHPTVNRLPEKLDPPSFDQPEIFEISLSVKVSDVLPGALVQVFVDGTPYGQAEAYSDHVTVPLVGPHFPGGIPLIRGQFVTVVQSFNWALEVKPASLSWLLAGDGIESSVFREQGVLHPAE